MNRSETEVDTSVPTMERFKWPKVLPALSSQQKAISEKV